MLNYIRLKKYFIINVVGLAIAVVSIYTPAVLKQPLLTIASVLLTLGITLPIALYAQSKLNSMSFNIIKACQDSGIKAIFVSRKEDSTALRKAIDVAFQNSRNEICLLGIAFRSLFDPNDAHTSGVSQAIDNCDPRY